MQGGAQKQFFDINRGKLLSQDKDNRKPYMTLDNRGQDNFYSKILIVEDKNASVMLPNV
jgi:hypothetical protein